MSHRLPLICCCLVGGAACEPSAGAGGEPDAWVAAVDTLADTIVARTLRGSVWRDTVALIPEVSIGVVEGADEYLLGYVAALAVTDDHHVYILDTQVPVLRKYDPDGQHLGDLAREGSGPGEYRSPDGGLAILSDGRLVLRDPGNARFTVYSGADEFLETWRHPSGGGFTTNRPLYVDRGDTLRTMIIANSGGTATEWQRALVAIHPDGRVGDTLLVPTWDFDRPQVTGRSETSSGSTRVPFGPDTYWTWSPEGYFVGSHPDRYRIDLFRTNQLILRLERDYVPVPVIPAEAAERERQITRLFEARYEGWRWNGPPIPDVKPPVRGLWVGHDGRIWVRTSQPATPVMGETEAADEEARTGEVSLRYREPVAFDVFDAGGRYLGHVQTPTGFRTTPAPVFRDDRVWAVVRDESDVNTVVRFRLDRNR